MSKFIPNKEYYGGYAFIKTDYSADIHMYKIVNAIESNSYCDVPIKCNSEPYLHKSVVPVLNVIHCGIDETKVVRVAVSDIERIELPTEVVRCKDCKYFQDNNNGYPHEECRWGKGETPDPDDYCSYGERNDNNVKE